MVVIVTVRLVFLACLEQLPDPIVVSFQPIRRIGRSLGGGWFGSRLVLGIGPPDDDRADHAAALVGRADVIVDALGLEGPFERLTRLGQVLALPRLGP